MKETKIMKVFDNYVKRFDMNRGNVKAMYFHSIKMMELCKSIANSLGVFTEEEVKVCGMIGLFHDISMFSNKLKTSIILDDDGDYARESINILFESDKLIRDITSDTKYDDVIKVVIYCQNKRGLPKGFSDKVLHFCKVIKDAHVIEKFRMVTNCPYMDMYIDNYPSDLVYNTFKNYRVIDAKISDNDADKILEVMSAVFGIYYRYSFSLLKEEDSVNRLLNSLHISNKNLSKFFYQISSVLNVYIDRKIGEGNA